jgi:hypothetical protein
MNKNKFQRGIDNNLQNIIGNSIEEKIRMFVQKGIDLENTDIVWKFNLNELYNNYNTIVAKNAQLL